MYRGVARFRGGSSRLDLGLPDPGEHLLRPDAARAGGAPEAPAARGDRARARGGARPSAAPLDRGRALRGSTRGSARRSCCARSRASRTARRARSWRSPRAPRAPCSSAPGAGCSASSARGGRLPAGGGVVKAALPRSRGGAPRGADPALSRPLEEHAARARTARRELSEWRQLSRAPRPSLRSPGTPRSSGRAIHQALAEESQQALRRRERDSAPAPRAGAGFRPPRWPRSSRSRRPGSGSSATAAAAIR